MEMGTASSAAVPPPDIKSTRAVKIAGPSSTTCSSTMTKPCDSPGKMRRGKNYSKNNRSSWIKPTSAYNSRSKGKPKFYEKNERVDFHRRGDYNRGTRRSTTLPQNNRNNPSRHRHHHHNHHHHHRRDHRQHQHQHQQPKVWHQDSSGIIDITAAYLRGVLGVKKADPSVLQQVLDTLLAHGKSGVIQPPKSIERKMRGT